MTGQRIMKKLRTGIGMLLGGLFVLTLSAQDITKTNGSPTVVVGTFDSRAVAVAYVQSDAFRTYLVAQRADVAQVLERARSAGDEELVAELDALGPAMQKRLHEQGFGAAPVDDIIARIEEKLPDIARKAGVDVIVSKWTLTYRGPETEFIDVTGLIAAEFNPNERTLKTRQCQVLRHGFAASRRLAWPLLTEGPRVRLPGRSIDRRGIAAGRSFVVVA